MRPYPFDQHLFRNLEAREMEAVNIFKERSLRDPLEPGKFIRDWHFHDSIESTHEGREKAISWKKDILRAAMNLPDLRYEVKNRMMI